jgi:hypothetical protein
MELRFMSRRYKAIEAAYATLKKHPLKSIFLAKKTIHAGLELRWLKPAVQEELDLPKDKFQIVVARIKPRQKTLAHLHEVGASSFMVLGPDVDLPDSQELFFNCGMQRHIMGTQRVTSWRKDITDIFPLQIHQFDNRGEKMAYVLIVVHPVISTAEDQEDIYFVK